MYFMEVKTKGKGADSEGNAKDKESKKDKGEEKLGGNISLSGFSLEPMEMIVAKKIIGTYVKKIREKTDYQEAKVTLKQTQKAKMFLHEINVQVKTKAGKLLTASCEDKNLYKALGDALEKSFQQAEKLEK